MFRFALMAFIVATVSGARADVMTYTVRKDSLDFRNVSFTVDLQSRGGNWEFTISALPKHGSWPGPITGYMSVRDSLGELASSPVAPVTDDSNTVIYRFVLARTVVEFSSFLFAQTYELPGGDVYVFSLKAFVP